MNTLLSFSHRMAYTGLGKTMATILRHTAAKEGLFHDQEGFVDIQDFLSLESMRDFSYDDVVHTMRTDNKMRFEAAQIENQWQIRAIQGHTLPSVFDHSELVRDLSDLRAFQNSDLTCNIIHPFHRTTVREWNTRVQYEGLNRRYRKYIVFAYGEPMDDDVYIYLDVVRAFRDGMFLYKCGEFLYCMGDRNGCIDPSYFSAVDVCGERVFRQY